MTTDEGRMTNDEEDPERGEDLLTSASSVFLPLSRAIPLCPGFPFVIRHSSFGAEWPPCLPGFPAAILLSQLTALAQGRPGPDPRLTRSYEALPPAWPVSVWTPPAGALAA